MVKEFSQPEGFEKTAAYPAAGQQSALSGVAGPISQTQFVIQSAASESREIRTLMIDDPHDCIWQSSDL